MKQTIYLNSSIIHRLSPKLKLVTLTSVSTFSFLFYNLYFYIGSLFIILFLYFLANIPLHKLKEQVRPTFYLLLIIFGTHVIWYDWLDGIKIITRFAVLILLGSLVTLTTHTSDMIDTLDSLLKPLSRLGIDTRKVSLALSLAIRFIPIIMKVFNEVRIAQSVRGLEKNLLATILPSVVKILKTADEVAEAIESRS